ncbi:MAG: putative peroxiredoxin [Candidatus Heimdallarchaeota archaeon LC_3]|nr:MAG: putative peroxiredoxin [Candidatus Heimdallarchaeota archaeon LC_3]
MSVIDQEKTKINPKEIIDENIQKLKDQGIAPGLSVGDQAPDFDLPDENGDYVSLYELITEGDAVVLSFYRGDWCSHCNRELKSLQDALPQITSLGASIVAIAPQRSENAKGLVDSHSLGFPLLSDEKMETIKNYNIHFTKPYEIQKIYKNILNLNLPELTANKTWELPVPATFIIDRNGIIRAKFVDLNYKNRMGTVEIINILKSINS